MMTLLGRFLFLVSVWAVFTGCGMPDEGVEQDTLPTTINQAIEDERPPPNGANGRSPTCFWAHGSQQALRTLGAAALDQGGGFIASIPLSQIARNCREVLRSAVECALTLDQTVSDPVTGETYRGWWGLAPSWLGGALSVVGRRYVTACMVQRLNASGARVPILLEGDHPAIVHNPAHCPQYPMMESTVFGDLFSSTTPLDGLQPAFDAYVCWEFLLPQECGSANLPLHFERRICNGLPQCGLTVLGPCNQSCMLNGPYWQCKPSFFAPWWTQTVRVKLERATCR